MLYHFQLELSDIDRGVYETLDFRVAQHPSEAAPYLLSRVLAYALSYRENLEFTPGGLNDPESPALRALGTYGDIDLWIEIGNPSARRLHKANKAAKQVRVYTYKSGDLLVKEIKEGDVHHASTIEIFAFESSFLQNLEKHLGKNNRWSILHQQGQLSINTGFEDSLFTELQRFS